MEAGYDIVTVFFKIDQKFDSWIALFGCISNYSTDATYFESWQWIFRADYLLNCLVCMN